MGLLLLLLGGILAAFGVISDPAIYARSLGMNVNLWWGVVLALVGGVMVALARRAKS
jgi:multisubunit Na+/H+ antiporter MnhG subunit